MSFPLLAFSRTHLADGLHVGRARVAVVLGLGPVLLRRLDRTGQLGAVLLHHLLQRLLVLVRPGQDVIERHARYMWGVGWGGEGGSVITRVKLLTLTLVLRGGAGRGKAKAEQEEAGTRKSTHRRRCFRSCSRTRCGASWGPRCPCPCTGAHGARRSRPCGLGWVGGSV
jgi:hypothetical protein